MPRRLVLPLVGVVFSIVGIWAVVLGTLEVIDEHEFATRGALASGSIIGKMVERAGQKGREDTRYVVSYRFATPTGKIVEGRRVLPVDVWEAVKAGDAISVRYLPDHPELNREASEGGLTDGLVIMFLGVMFASAGAGIVGYLGVRTWHDRHLFRSGIVAEARVLSVEETSFQINGVPQWRLHYSFRDADGHEHEGATGMQAPEAVAGWQSGDAGNVVYRPNKPDESLWVGKP